jgi:hypothetical protein
MERSEFPLNPYLTGAAHLGHIQPGAVLNVFSLHDRSGIPHRTVLVTDILTGPEAVTRAELRGPLAVPYVSALSILHLPDGRERVAPMPMQQLPDLGVMPHPDGQTWDPRWAARLVFVANIKNN